MRLLTQDMSGKRPNKLKAFTIVELLVVLAVSGIVLSFVWIGYIHLTQYTHLIKEKVESKVEMNKFKYVLNRDVTLLQNFEVKTPQLFLYTSGDTITYISNDSSTLRTNTANDSLIVMVGCIFMTIESELIVYARSGEYTSRMKFGVDKNHGIESVLE